MPQRPHWLHLLAGSGPNIWQCEGARVLITLEFCVEQNCFQLSSIVFSFSGIQASTGSGKMSQQNFSCLSFLPLNLFISWHWLSILGVLILPWKQDILSSSDPSTYFTSKKITLKIFSSSKVSALVPTELSAGDRNGLSCSTDY